MSTLLVRNREVILMQQRMKSDLAVLFEVPVGQIGGDVSQEAGDRSGLQKGDPGWQFEFEAR